MIKREHVTLSEHAASRMSTRGITFAELLRVMNDGELIQRPRPPRFILVAEHPIRHGVVRVVWSVTGGRLHVITVMWKE